MKKQKLRIAGSALAALALLTSALGATYTLDVQSTAGGTAQITLPAPAASAKTFDIVAAPNAGEWHIVAAHQVHGTVGGLPPGVSTSGNTMLLDPTDFQGLTIGVWDYAAESTANSMVRVRVFDPISYSYSFKYAYARTPVGYYPPPSDQNILSGGNGRTVLIISNIARENGLWYGDVSAAPETGGAHFDAGSGTWVEPDPTYFTGRINFGPSAILLEHGSAALDYGFAVQFSASKAASTFSLTATPAPGYTFDGWTVVPPATATVTPTGQFTGTITPTENTLVMANFSWDPIITLGLEPTPPLPPTAVITATPNTGTAPLSTTIDWSTSNAGVVNVTSALPQDGFPTTATSGSNLLALNSDETFTVTAEPSASTTAEWTIDVTPTGFPTTWTITDDAATVLASGTIETAGTITLPHPGTPGTRSYYLDVAVDDGSGIKKAGWLTKTITWPGQATATATVTVEGAATPIILALATPALPPPPAVTITADSATGVVGSSPTISWTSINAVTSKVAGAPQPPFPFNSIASPYAGNQQVTLNAAGSWTFSITGTSQKTSSIAWSIAGGTPTTWAIEIYDPVHTLVGTAGSGTTEASGTIPVAAPGEGLYTYHLTALVDGNTYTKDTAIDWAPDAYAQVVINAYVDDGGPALRSILTREYDETNFPLFRPDGKPLYRVERYFIVPATGRRLGRHETMTGADCPDATPSDPSK